VKKLLVPVAIIIVLALAVLAFFFLRNLDADIYCFDILQKSSAPPDMDKLKRIIKSAWGIEPTNSSADEVALKTAPSDDGTTLRYLVKCQDFGFGISYDPKPFPFKDYPFNTDPKMQEALEHNRAFWEICFVNPQGKPNETAKRKAAQLAKQLVDADTLAVLSISYQVLNPMTENVQKVLAGENAQTVFDTQIYEPMVKVSEQESRQLKEKAQKSLSNFVSAFEKRNPEDTRFSIKSRIEDKNGPEHVWIKVDSIKSISFHGEIDNEPVIATSYHLGQELSVKQSEIEDWGYMHGKTLIQGSTK
jgi:uncharacterized protein YegJ (DUF2314 family)